jgi:alpha-1,2-mannosyltransferase
VSLALWWFPIGGYRFDLKIYVEAARERGAALYDYAEPVVGLGFTYPPFASLLFRPFTALNETVADRLWFTLSFCASIGFLAGCVKLMPPSQRRSWMLPVAIGIGVWLVPVMVTFRLGQVNAIIAVLVLCDVWLMRRDSKWAGIGTGIASAIKLTPALLIVLCWFVFRRREAIVMVGTATLCTVFAALVSWDATWRYFTDTIFDSGRVGDLDDGYSNSIRRLAAWFPTGTQVDSLIWLALSFGLVGWAIRRLRISGAETDPLRLVTVGMLLSALVAPVTWSHHLYFMAPALLMVVEPVARWRFRWVAAAVMLAVAVDPIQLGEGPHVSAMRIALMLWLVWQLTGSQPVESRALPEGVAEANAGLVGLRQVPHS